MKRQELLFTEDLDKFMEEEHYKIVEGMHDWRQFRNCQAWYCKAKLGNEHGTKDVLILQSYSTAVAVWIRETGECIRLRRYSRTTSKQTTQWENMLVYSRRYEYGEH